MLGKENQVLWVTSREPSQETRKQGSTKAEEHRPPWVAIISIPVSSAARKGLRPAGSLASLSSLLPSTLPYVLVTLLESGIHQPPALPNSYLLLTQECFPFYLSPNLSSFSPSSHPLSSLFLFSLRGPQSCFCSSSPKRQWPLITGLTCSPSMPRAQNSGCCMLTEWRLGDQRNHCPAFISASCHENGSFSIGLLAFRDGRQRTGVFFIDWLVSWLVGFCLFCFNEI